MSGKLFVHLTTFFLGDKPNKYGNQRLFGALGWGTSSALAGYLIDWLSQGKSEKNYAVAFYMAAVFLVLDFFTSSRIKVINYISIILINEIYSNNYFLMESFAD